MVLLSIFKPSHLNKAIFQNFNLTGSRKDEPTEGQIDQWTKKYKNVLEMKLQQNLMIWNKCKENSDIFYLFLKFSLHLYFNVITGLYFY